MVPCLFPLSLSPRKQLCTRLLQQYTQEANANSNSTARATSDHDPTAIVSRLHRRNLKTSTCAVTDDGDDDGCGIMIAGSAGGGIGVCVRHLRFAEDLAS